MARELSYFGRFKKKEGWESKALRFVFVMSMEHAMPAVTHTSEETPNLEKGPQRSCVQSCH